MHHGRDPADHRRRLVAAPVTKVRQLIAAGDIEVGESVPFCCKVAWLRIDGDCVRFGPTTETGVQQWRLPLTAEVWVERDGDPSRFAVRPLTVS